MLKKKAPPPVAFDSGGPGTVQGGISHWQPVWCAEHHFETVAAGLNKCQHGCPPGPFMRALWTPAREILLEGGRGGGKTELGRGGFLLKGNLGEPRDHPDGQHLIINPGRPDAYCALCVNGSYIHHPNYRALVLRQNEKDLADWIARARSLYDPMGASVTEKPARVIWPHPSRSGAIGATFVLGHMQDAASYTDYMGQEFHRMIFEELTQTPPNQEDSRQCDLYEQITMSCRSTFRCAKKCKFGTCVCGALNEQILATTNPLGVGHLWVKTRFIAVAGPDELYTDLRSKQTRIHIPSYVTDNPYYMKTGHYADQLEGLTNPVLRAAWRRGDWNALAGAFFTDFRPKGPLPGDPPEANHVIPAGSKPLLPWWPYWTGCDWGYGHNFAVYGACQIPNGQVIVDLEITGREVGEVELGAMIARALFPRLKAMEIDGIEPTITLWLSPDAFGKRGESLTHAELIARGISTVLGPNSAYFPDAKDLTLTDFAIDYPKQRKFGIEIRLANNNRTDGWGYMRELMRFKQLTSISEEKYDHEYACKLLHESAERYREYLRAFEARKPEVLPKLQISDACKHIIEAIPTLVYKPGTEDVLKTDTSSDDCADACFVAGTMIATERGGVPIEQVRTGDRVMTRAGYQSVTDSAQTGHNLTLKLLLSNGTTLQGTGNHPIFVKDIGFVPLDSLRYGDKLYAWRNVRLSYSTESPIGAIQTLPIGTTAAITRHPVDTYLDQGPCMLQSGCPSMAQSQRVITSTMRTTIHSIMTQRTWNALRPKSIARGISRQRVPNVVANWSTEFATWLRHGMVVRRGSGGIQSMADGWRQELLPLMKSANTAVSHIGPKPHIRRSFAQIIANRQRDGKRVRICRSVNARNAGSPSKLASTAISNAAPVHVVHITSGEVVPVYNLTVENQPEYFANGVLVHNCRYLLHSQNSANLREPQRVFVQRHLDKVREQNPNIDVSQLVWSARLAESTYAEENGPKRPFDIPVESSRRFRRSRRPN